MSLYKYFESILKENPELHLTRQTGIYNYDELSNYLKKRENKSQFEKYLNMFYYNSMINYGKNLQDYEILKLKIKNISLAMDKLYNSKLHTK